MEKEIIWDDLNKSLRLEQSLTKGIEFSYVSDDNYQCTPFAYCRDYLHDIIQSRLYENNKKIYGLNYKNNSKKSPSLKCLKLLVTDSKTSNFKEKIYNAIKMINQIEDKLKIKRTIIFECKNPPYRYKKNGIYYLKGSIRWIKSPPMISLFAFLIKTGIHHDPSETYEDTFNKILLNKVKMLYKNDRTKLKYIKPTLEKIIKYGDKKIFSNKFLENYPDPKKVDKYIFHSCYGIVGFSKELTRKEMPNWYKI